MSLRRSVGPEPTADRRESDRLLDAARRTAATGDAAARDQRVGDPAAADGEGAAATAAGEAVDPLFRLLVAAAGPARPVELAGEEAALAAFRAAHAAPTSAPARAPGRRRLTVGALAWIGALAVTATAGVAVAATALDRAAQPVTAPSSLPTRPSDPGPTGPVTTGPGPTATGTATPAPSTATPGPGPSGRPSGPSPSGPRTPTGPGHPGDAQLPGLCRAYLDKPVAGRRRALTTPGFAPLVTAAGGAGQVEGFCRALLADGDPGPPARSQRPEPDRTGRERTPAGRRRSPPTA
ncbi:hypothetical protein [Micromonospora sp. DT233]|uniref:hypothetical protein n=1 Tax=Micromonospora sp. DT233 TaxID=3393432 RepID=UPI003CEAB29B